MIAQNCTRIRLESRFVLSCSSRISLENGGFPSLLDYQLSKETKDVLVKRTWKDTRMNTPFFSQSPDPES